MLQTTISLLEEELAIISQRLDASPPPVVDQSSPGAAIDLIKTSLGLTVAELGGLFQVTRQTVYDWKKERTAINGAIWDKILSLAAAAQFWQKKTGGHAPRFLLDRPDPDTSESILELCRLDQPDWDTIKKQMANHWEWYQSSLAEAFDDMGYDAPVVRTRRKPGPSTPQKHYAEFKVDLEEPR